MDLCAFPVAGSIVGTSRHHQLESQAMSLAYPLGCFADGAGDLCGAGRTQPARV